ncbi:MAG TPA: UDP-N-acetylglucosamine acyltransferase [Nocardioides sp.]|uniref:UDP-N-acetylglucosamine acyltransferase n=1 Tax=Nocardioides sp. TaxID=35761 RepID=UPI002EDAA408
MPLTAASNRIHPTAVIGPEVQLGERNVVGPYCVLQGPVTIGDDNYLASHVVIGGAGEVRGHAMTASWEEPFDGGPVQIGSRNVLKEFVTISGGWAGRTTLGDDCFVMTKVHINHDGRIGDEVTLSAMAVTAGHVTVEEGANLGLGVVVHQRLTVPAGSMVGMQSAVTNELPPYAVSMGVPARPARLNTYRLDKLDVPRDQHAALAAVVLEGSRDTSGLDARLRGAVEAWLDRTLC